MQSQSDGIGHLHKPQWENGMRVQVDDKIRQECELSYYHTIGVLNEAHEVFYVQHKENHKIYVKKNLYVYNREIYEFIRQINSK